MKWTITGIIDFPKNDLIFKIYNNVVFLQILDAPLPFAIWKERVQGRQIRFMVTSGFFLVFAEDLEKSPVRNVNQPTF